MPEASVAETAVNIARSIGIMGGAVVVALALYLATVRIVFRVGRTDRFFEQLVSRCKWPARTTVVVLALLSSMPFTQFPDILTDQLVHLLQIMAILAGTWTVLRLAAAIEATLLGELDLDVPEGESTWVRGRQTRTILLRRIVAGVTIILAIGGLLLTFDTARTLGQSLLASAGIFGLIAGIAAQATLGNIIAGIQLAVAEPIRIDDVVVVEGQWGNIEDVALTYVVVRTWDRRRIVLPTSYFMDNTFENWTRNGTQVIGQVTWRLDHRTPVQSMREEFHRQAEDNPLWDGDVSVLQVVETNDSSIDVRALVTAPTSRKAFDLRCAIREGMLAWLVENHPESLPVQRLIEGPAAPAVAAGTDPVAGGDFTEYLHRSPGPATVPNPDPSRTGEWPVIER